MIEEIRIASLGVIEESVLEIGSGFTAITGETGAGKTMLITALGLLMGGRSDPGSVRTGQARARVEGVFNVQGRSNAVGPLVDGLGGDLDDDRLLLGRHVSAEGRSRAFVGGVGAPASALTKLAEPLIAVHCQAEQLRLVRPEAQRAALDRYAGPEAVALRAEFSSTYRHWRQAISDLADVKAQARQRAQEGDLLRFGLSEVEAVDPQPREDSALAAEETRLGFADALRRAAEQARNGLTSEESDGVDALGLVFSARAQLDGVRDHDPQAADLADRLTELGYLLGDVAADVASYASNLDNDPARLEVVSQRRAALTALKRKYGETIEEVLAWAQVGAQRLLTLEDSEGETQRLEGEITRCLTQLATVGETLSCVRRVAAEALAVRVSEELTHLAMPAATLRIAISQNLAPEEAPEAVPSAGRFVMAYEHGFDKVEFLLAPNPALAERALHKGASGGELSRVMLALEVALADSDAVPTFVFDEVDAGVGGAAAVEVGRRLAMLAQRAQVIVVTHLPQVAAFADHHVVVAKDQSGGFTTSSLTKLDDSGRVQELSRMLAGLEGSATAAAHAEELLRAARTR